MNFNNYNEEYNSLNKHLETLKNKMSIVLTNDIIELIQKKLEDLNKITLNEDIQNAINSFYSTYKSNLQNYYSYIREIKKERKIGKGGMGELYLGEWQGKQVAIKKRIKLNHIKSNYLTNKFII